MFIGFLMQNTHKVRINRMIQVCFDFSGAITSKFEPD